MFAQETMALRLEQTDQIRATEARSHEADDPITSLFSRRRRLPKRMRDPRSSPARHRVCRYRTE